MQNKSDVYTINDTAPPSYTEATSSDSRDYLHQVQSPQYRYPQMMQRYPHMIVSSLPSVPYLYSPNCYVNTTLVQSPYPEQQSQSMNVPHDRTLIVETREDNVDCIPCCRLLWILCILVSIIGIITAIIYRIRR